MQHNLAHTLRIFALKMKIKCCFNSMASGFHLLLQSEAEGESLFVLPLIVTKDLRATDSDEGHHPTQKNSEA